MEALGDTYKNRRQATDTLMTVTLNGGFWVVLLLWASLYLPDFPQGVWASKTKPGIASTAHGFPRLLVLLKQGVGAWAGGRRVGNGHFSPVPQYPVQV